VTEHSTLPPQVAVERRPRPPERQPRSPESQVRLSIRRERLRRRCARRIAARAGLLLVGYWIAAFALTHVPIPKGTGGPLFGLPHADKVVHVTIYAGLSLLLSVWFGVRKRIGGALAVAAIVLVCLATYAAFDELTQIPVGRSADLRDWIADVAGIHLGLLGFFALRAWVRR
jgi:hypothetical protein